MNVYRNVSPSWKNKYGMEEDEQKKRILIVVGTYKWNHRMTNKGADKYKDLIRNAEDRRITTEDVYNFAEAMRQVGEERKRAGEDENFWKPLDKIGGSNSSRWWCKTRTRATTRLKKVTSMF